jgi:hypothetical protein
MVVLAMAALFLLSAVGPVQAGERVVTVGLYENSPKIHTDGAGKPAGIFVEILQAIAAEEGWQLRYVPGTWSEGLARLESGEIDLMPDVAWSSERQERFAFPKEPVMASWFQVYAAKGSNIRSILDLKEKRITVLDGSIQQESFLSTVGGSGLNPKLVPLPDFDSCFRAVQDGEADATITNRLFGMMHARKFGLEETAILFHPTNLFYAAPKEGRQDLLDGIDRHLTVLKADPHSIYYESMQRGGSEPINFSLPTWVRVVGASIITALIGTFVGAIILKRQVNARTVELMVINHEMEERIEERTAELATAMERAQAADHLKSAFLATMSHELRTPLNSIIGFTGILLQRMAGPLNEEQEKQLGMVQGSARHLLALINDVLDISKVEAGQLELSNANFDLKDSVSRTASLVMPMALKKGLQLKVVLGDGVGAMHGDQRRVEQILLNLMNNALKFTDKGHVEVTCRSEAGFYIVSIADTGMGIKPEDLANLFRPFHQIDNGLARRHEGTGLGLSICKRLALMMGGHIDVKSEWGVGSTFNLHLPIQGVEPA